MSTKEQLQGVVEDRWQITLVYVFLVGGLFIGIIDWQLTGQQNALITDPINSHVLLISTVLFGVIEIPRIGRLDNEIFRFLAMMILMSNALLFIHLQHPQLLAGASAVALLMLYLTSIATLFFVPSVSEGAESGLLSPKGPKEAGALTIAEEGPKFLAVGIASLVIAL